MVIPLMNKISPSLRNENNKRIKLKNKAEAFIFKSIVYLLCGTALYFALFSNTKYNITISLATLILLFIYFLIYIYKSKS